MKSNLQHDTGFIGFYIIPSTKSIDVTSAVIKALHEEEPSIGLKKCTAQSYDGASNMQSSTLYIHINMCIVHINTIHN